LDLCSFSEDTEPFSEIAVPLTNLTKKNNSIVKWDDKYEQAFKELKKDVKSTSILRSRDWTYFVYPLDPQSNRDDRFSGHRPSGVLYTSLTFIG
jgi:hypothetical protein